jgi:trehalose 6-phosphate synthase
MDGGDVTTREHTRRRLVVVSNRGPVVYGRGEVGRSARRGGGGLVTALSGLVPAHDVTWVATAISDEDRVVAQEQPGAVEETDRSGHRFRLRLVHVDRAEYDRYYNVYANPHLWFIQHGLWNHPYTPELNAGIVQAWHSYRHVNERLAEAAASEAELVGADAVLVQDYQLYLVPQLLRGHGVSAPVSHFTHIPWPGSDAWRSARREAREAIIAGLLGANVVGFHTRRSARNFLAACEDYLPDCHVDYRRSDVEHEGRTTRVRAYPISVDPLEFDALAEDSRVREAAATLLEVQPERLILRVDRTDPSKNIVRGFTAFGRFLEQHPEWHKRVLMLALLDPSRQEIPEYAEYLGAVHRAARSVNDAHGRDGWNPIDLRVSDNFPRAVAAYKRYDVLLVNAIVDGMNLIAKEAPLVNERDGVVILSENAGAHEELGRHALTVNPFDVEETAAAIEAALVMPQPERAARAAGIRDHVRTHDVRVWISSQLRDLERRGAGAR